MLNLRMIVLWLLTSALMAACGASFDGSSGGGGGGNNELAGGGVGGSGDGDGGDETALLTVTLAGREAPALDALELVVEGVDLYFASDSESEESGEWMRIESDSLAFDVLQLTGSEVTLLREVPISSELPTKLRVRVSGAWVTVWGETFEMALSGNGAEIENLRQTVIPDLNGTVAIGLEFDSLHSVWLDGQKRFRLQPELSVIDSETSGAISGAVTPVGIGAEVTVYNSRNGALVAAGKVRWDGTYAIPRLPAFSPSGARMRYSIEASAPGYETLAGYTEVTIVPGVNSGGYDFALDPDITESAASGPKIGKTSFSSGMFR